MIDENGHPSKPCIALMGEFSAGKSTLANLLIGSDPLPVQVVATQLPPVCISHGDDAPYRVDLDGDRHPVDLNDLSPSDLVETAYLRIFCVEDILQQCDLLDMPGISDPNMSSEVWERMLPKADGVLWCSHATQAWRQSEAAVWAEMSEDLHRRSLLLLTRIDKLRTVEDRERVLRRVRKETKGLFAECLPISLLLATQEQSDYDLWLQSGAKEFAASLVRLLSLLNSELVQPTAGIPASAKSFDLRLSGLEATSSPEHESPNSAQEKVVRRRLRPLADPGVPPAGP